MNQSAKVECADKATRDIARSVLDLGGTFEQAAACRDIVHAFLLQDGVRMQKAISGLERSGLDMEVIGTVVCGLSRDPS